MKKSLTVLSVIMLITIGFYGQKAREQVIKELEIQLKTASGTERVDILNRLASFYYTTEPKRCIQYCEPALTLSKQLKYPKGWARALIYKSYALSVQGERKKNLEYGKEALTIFESLGDRKGIADAFGAIGYFYLQKDYTNIALEYFLKALKVYEELDDKTGFIYSNWNLGNLYLHLKEFQKSLAYFRDGLKIVEETGDELRRARFYHNIGMTYHDLEDYPRALEYFQNALKIFEASGQRYWIAATLLNMGITFLRVGQNQEALNSFLKSRRLCEVLENKEGMYYNFKNIGDLYAMKENYGRAVAYYDRALAIAKEMNDDSFWESIYKGYAELFAAKGDYKKAFEYHQLYIKAKDALITTIKNKQIAELQEKYETEKKIKEIEILRKNSRIQEITRNALIVIVFLAAVIIIILFKRYLYLFAFWKKQKYIGQYRIIERIDSGGMGTVYLAHNLRDKSETAAVKVLREELFKDEISRKRFKYEGTIIDSLVHPNIVSIYERGEYKGKLYIAMELLQGKTLAHTIEEEDQISIDRCLSIMIQLADALAFIHSKNIVHRDLKPANIMLAGKDGTGDVVKLLDFGLARTRFQTRLTRTGILVGTVNYMSPEQVSGLPSTPACDVYALGIIFYEMVTGRHAFPGDTITEIADKILASNPDEPKQYRPEIPAALNRLITQMLSKEPTQRPSAASVQDMLKAVLTLYQCAGGR
jgi:tetratricopeptide (TPR) repeat protein